MDVALLALVKKQFLEQGGSLDEFQEMVDVWESIEFARKMIAERFGGRQLHLVADCCEFLLRNLTPLEQEKVFVDLRHRINTRETRDWEVLQSWKQKKLWKDDLKEQKNYSDNMGGIK